MSNAIQLNITHSASNRPSEPKNPRFLSRIAGYFVARSQAKSILKGLAQAKEIKSGKVKAISFEEAIRSL